MREQKFMTIGIVGYIGGRSLEKITNQIFGAIPPGSRAKSGYRVQLRVGRMQVVHMFEFPLRVIHVGFANSARGPLILREPT